MGVRAEKSESVFWNSKEKNVNVAGIGNVIRRLLRRTLVRSEPHSTTSDQSISRTFLQR
jgi:hypothetical protein